ncbi:NADPH-dependent FMN reductase [Spirochaeta cellobiosiphila]|uniref:NADPH-dependent FMN reductase n=1 Tax=Spirochaeta cellobiosiphila TaxID=504483 RepID=UPI0003F5B063|nr:NAD(P)H-dependent oxidoreductase [Spirochaeta cellobiosiphila]
MAKNVKVILGSVRTNRAGKAVADYVMSQLGSYSGELEFDFIDLKDVNLPFMDEPVPPMMADGYTEDHTKAWSKTIAEADGFILVTPEYNHGYSPVLKNALDYLMKEWSEKPVGFVGYGGNGAELAIDQLKPVVEFLGMKPVSSQIGVNTIWEAIDEKGQLKADYVKGDVNKLAAEIESNIK